jgi:hypothetical protein
MGDHFLVKMVSKNMNVYSVAVVKIFTRMLT